MEGSDGWASDQEGVEAEASARRGKQLTSEEGRQRSTTTTIVPYVRYSCT